VQDGLVLAPGVPGVVPDVVDPFGLGVRDSYRAGLVPVGSRRAGGTVSVLRKSRVLLTGTRTDLETRAGDSRWGGDAVLGGSDGHLLPLRAGRGAGDLPRENLGEVAEQTVRLGRLALSSTGTLVWEKGDRSVGRFEGRTPGVRVRARGTVDRRVEWTSARDVGRTAIFFTGPLIFARWCKRAPWRVSEIIFLRARSFPARFALQSGWRDALLVL